MMNLTTLANGLRVASRTMKSVETVAVALYADCGSRNEAAYLNGIAHVFEHMVFKGAGGRSGREISELVESVGGDLNASTDREGTAFYASLLAPNLPLGVELLADLVRRPHFDHHDLAMEKRVIAQELAEARDNAGDIVFDQLQAAAFPDQPMGRSVLGEPGTLGWITVADLQDWRDAHYRSNQLILVAAGKLEHAILVDLAEKHFGDMTPGAAAEYAPAEFVGGWNYEKRGSRQAHLAIGMAAPSWRNAENYSAQLFADVIGHGASSRLFQELREQRGLAYSVSAISQSYSDCGLFSVYLATDRRHAKLAQEEAERVLADAVVSLTTAELDRARALAKASMMMNLESCWGQASYVASRLQREGRLVEPAEIIERLDSVTLDQVKDAGARMLSGPRALASVGAKLARAA